MKTQNFCLIIFTNHLKIVNSIPDFKEKKHITKFWLTSFLTFFTPGFNPIVFCFWTKPIITKTKKDLSYDSHWSCSIRKVFLKDFRNFTEKHLRWSLLLIKLQAFRHAV